MKNLNKRKILYLCLVVVILIVFIILVAPYLKYLSSDDGIQYIINKVNKYKIAAPIVFILIQSLQIIVAILPGEPLEIAAGTLFGVVPGCLLCLTGALIGTIAIYYLVKKFGKSLIDLIVGNEKIKHLKFLQNEKELELIIFILFFIPGTPKDALTYFVPMTKIKPLNFFMISTIARIPSIISSTIVGGNIGNGHYMVSIVVFIITAIVSVVGILVHRLIIKRKNKNKEVE